MAPKITRGCARKSLTGKKMGKKQRIGADPFSWIKDSRQEEAPSLPVQEETVAESFPVETPGSAESQTTRQGLRVGWKRHTFIIREQHLEKIQAVAYWERRDIKEVMDEALQLYLKEKDVGSIPG
jgi:hypothetical protein